MRVGIKDIPYAYYVISNLCFCSFSMFSCHRVTRQQAKIHMQNSLEIILNGASAKSRT